MARPTTTWLRSCTTWMIGARNCTNFIDETGEFVHATPYRAGAHNERALLMLGISMDGVDL